MQKENWNTRRHGSAILLLLVTGMLKRTTCLQTAVNFKYMYNWAITYDVTKLIEFQAWLWQNNLSALGVCDQGRRKQQTVSTGGNRRGVEGNYEKGSDLSVLCNTMHKQNLTFQFKFVKARGLLDSSHMLDVLLNVKLVYLVTCQNLDYSYMAFRAQNGSALCSKFHPNTGHEGP